MSAILLANKNTAGSGMTAGTAYDSGQIVTISSPGKNLPRRLVMGLQQQSTQAIQADNTAGVQGGNNWVNGPQPTQVQNKATITNISSSTTAGVTTVVVTAVNTFAAGNTVEFTGLTTLLTLNGLCGVVLAAGLSGAGFSCTVVKDTNVATQTSHAETGTTTVNYSSRAACLSLDSELG